MPIDSTSWKSKYNFFEVDKCLSELENSDLYISILDKKASLPVWQSPFNSFIPEDPTATEHITELNFNKLPQTNEPPMMLHGLGSFSSDPKLRIRIADIFRGNNTFLLNASGTGKTRILFEGLCQNWGLYFTSAVDTTYLGLPDLQYSLHDTGDLGWHPDFTKNLPSTDSTEELNRNLDLACRSFSSILLFRLLLFKSFLKSTVSRGGGDEYKTIWLQVQLCLWPDFFTPVQNLVEMLLQVLPANKDFEHAISETLTEILAIADITAAGPIFLALDEANYASHSLEHSFRDTNGRYYPALRVVLATWKHHLERCKVAFVVAGTEIPREHFTGEEWADWHWTSNTGGFDSSEDQRRYISKYLPPTLASDASGKRLLDRMWKWIRGRHRFTAAFVSVLLDNRFYLPHVQLNRYVYKVTDGYRPKDIERVDRGALVEERMPFSPISFDSLDSNRRFASCIHATLISFLFHSPKRVYFLGNDVALVNHTFARFADTTCDLITIDEPFIIAGAARWYSGPEHSLIDLDHFKDKILEPTISFQHSLGYLALCIAATFDCEDERGLLISKVFRFPKVTRGGRGRGNIRGNIVTCKVSKKQTTDTVLRYSNDPSHKTVHWSHSSQDTLSWIKKPSTAFCIHSPETDSATLIFIIKTSNGKRFWVFLRVLPPTSDEELPTKAKALMDSCHPKRLFEDTSSPSEAQKALKALPDLAPYTGRSGVLRTFVSFDQNLDVSELGSDEESVVTKLNLAMVASSTKAYSSDKVKMEAIADAVVMSAVSFDAPQKRKRDDVEDEEGEGSGSRSSKRQILRSGTKEEGDEMGVYTAQLVGGSSKGKGKRKDVPGGNGNVTGKKCAVAVKNREVAVRKRSTGAVKKATGKGTKTATSSMTRHTTAGKEKNAPREMASDIRPRQSERIAANLAKAARL